MVLNLKEVLDPQEFYQFISLLKDIVPYQLKVSQANGCVEILKQEEKQVYQQLQQELKPYYDKLDKAWFT
ncbi:hypothetical protein [Lederbergia galactosidilytica]|uniref:LAGLIDADG homing endonuclease n=1 Tax=Lederbergia galactosidilytica TaxID=217031 RepID=A0A0Q9YDG4_9BACI|nr:hypothetical protein [Lederbergia galactosidilytica]KRG14072.1 hypothetical protein ACA29_07105 [Lederbergia galactosidilytica]MBP1914214.1 hypothetical protein [Lederbergia galactosidilytica]OAK67334.1 hypothetical protein ABB05_19465 [Lederbergia galactosidilytica]